MADNPTAVQQGVQRALSEALGTVQRQLAEVQSSFDTVKRAVESGQAGADSFVGLLPPLLHMQASGASLAATIESVLRFIGASAQWTGVPATAMPVSVAAPAPPPAAPAREAKQVEEAEEEAATVEVEPAVAAEPAESVHEIALEAPAAEPALVEAAAPAAPARVDVSSLPDDLKQLHQKAKRFAKVTVQELIMYKKDEVAKGRENNDLYSRFKDEIDKSKQLYDKRFEKIAAHNIDYLYDELVRVLADNNADALGNYPYRPR